MVIGTKKDEFWDMQYGKSRKLFNNEAELEAHADKELRDRMSLIELELSAIDDGRCDAIVAVSKGKQYPCTDEHKLTLHYQTMRSLSAHSQR